MSTVQTRKRKPTTTDDPAAVWVDTTSLKPWSNNPRVNDAVAVARVARSIKRFGWGAPILARKANNEIIAGHTRWLAAKQLGQSNVPVRFLDIDESEAHTLALADNRLNELGQWDDAQLAALLKDYDFVEDVAIAGWSQSELDTLLASASASDTNTPTNTPDEFAEIDPTKPLAHTCPKCGYGWD